MKKTMAMIMLLISISVFGESRKSFFTLNLENVDRNEEVVRDGISNELINNGLSLNTFQDSLMNISFQYEMTHINFILKNLSSKTLKIHWDDAALYIHGNGYTIFHNGTIIKDRFEHKHPTSILKGMKLSDMIIPCETTSWWEQFGRWFYEALLSEPELDNTDVKILLPIEINNNVIEYVFNFTAHYHKQKVKVIMVNGGMWEYVEVK